MLLILLLLGACAYLWSEQRKLLELRVADAIRLLQEKAEEIKLKDAQVLSLTNEIEGLEKQLLLLSQINGELERRIEEAESEASKRVAEIEKLREAESDLKVFYSTVVATRDREFAILQSDHNKEIQKLTKDKEQAEAAKEELEQKNLELRDRVSEYHRRVNDKSYTEEPQSFHYPHDSLSYNASPNQGHRRQGAIGGVRESVREASLAPVDTRIWGFTVPHGMGL